MITYDDGGAWVSPAVFLDLGAVPLNELAVVMDVRPVREEKVCCALAQHRAKEGSQWWNPGGKIVVERGCIPTWVKNFCGRTSPTFVKKNVTRIASVD